MAPPKAIFLDLDDTLIFSNGLPEQAWNVVLAGFAGRVAAHGIAEIHDAVTAAARWFWSDPARHRVGRLDILVARRTIVGAAFEALGIDDDELASELADEFNAHRKRETRLHPGVHETLEALADRGLKLALVTNGAGKPQREKIERFDLGDRFDHILIEGEFGVGKPEPRVYEFLMDLFGVGADETWMVGDNLEWEVAAPQRLGIRGIWCNPLGARLPADKGIRPDHVIGGVPELLALI
jgi:putative hydrolase of the HAD superfamily